MNIGTKEMFRGWLLEVKRMTYTKYSELPTDKKQAIQKEYANKHKSMSKSTVILTEAPKEENLVGIDV